ncbi:MAG TPA: hypothetical protein VMA73_16710 [Streptosporangiaceae bacterium]|nr:hypothetical protein [Streptosporangiaceae bacterium]
MGHAVDPDEPRPNPGPQPEGIRDRSAAGDWLDIEHEPVTKAVGRQAYASQGPDVAADDGLVAAGFLVRVRIVFSLASSVLTSPR